jgi:hypothetical protein
MLAIAITVCLLLSHRPAHRHQHLTSDLVTHQGQYLGHRNTFSVRRLLNCDPGTLGRSSASVARFAVSPFRMGCFPRAIP